MLLEVVTFSLTVLTSIASLTTHSLFWQQPTPLQSPIPKAESIVQKKPSSQTPTQVPTPTTTLSPTITPTPTNTPTPTPEPTIATAQDLESLFTKFADEYHVDKELLKRIAKCESGYNSRTRNDMYGGMYQFAEQTWSTVRGRMGLDPNPDLRFTAEEAIRTAAYHLANGGQSSWPNCN